MLQTSRADSDEDIYAQVDAAMLTREERQREGIRMLPGSLTAALDTMAIDKGAGTVIPVHGHWLCAAKCMSCPSNPRLRGGTRAPSENTLQ